MKRFRFPLRPVAVLRAHREARAREAFASAVHAYVQTEENLAHTRARMVALEQTLFVSRQGQFLAAEVAAQFRAYRGECEQEIAVERTVIEARNVMNQRRQEYLEASRELKIVHRLEEKARFRHRAEVLHAEQVEMDDFAGFRASRRPVLS